MSTMTAAVGTRSSSPGDALPELVAAAVAGNRTAWDTLVECFAPLVTSVTRRFGLTQCDADDVRQNVWLRLVEHIADIREPRALPGWIVTTTRREALRVLSGRRRVEVADPHTDTRLDISTTGEPDANLLQVERRQAVHAGLAELPAPHRDLLLLTVVDTGVIRPGVSAQTTACTGRLLC
jgi:RNA polymerase sigma factor (sigma-70 family)